MAGRLRFSGPKTYNPQLARASAAASRVSRDEELRRQLGLGDDGESSSDESVVNGTGPSSAEVEALREQLEQAQANAEAQRERFDTELRNMQWKMRASTLASKKKVDAQANLISEMIDALYDLEQQIEDSGDQPKKVWSEHYDAERENVGAARGSPQKRRGGADSVDGAGDESTHATDNVALIALRRENERLQGELERVKAQAKSAAAAAAPPPPPPAPAAAAAPPPVPAASSEELSALRKSLKKRTQEAESLQADATAAREENAALQARVRELQARLEDVAAGGDANAAASAAAAARVQALEDDKAALQQQLEGAQADAKSQARAHQKQQADAQQRLDASATKIEELTAETERLQAQQREASAALASAAGEAEALLQKRLVAVEEELQQQKAATQDAQNANQANIEAAQAALATWKEKYTHVKTERKQYKHQLQAAAADLRSLQQEVATHKDAAAKAEARVTVLDKQVGGLKSQLEAREKENASASGDAATLRESLRTAEARATELEEQVARAQGDLKTSQSTVAGLERDAAAAKEQLAAARDAHAQAETDMQTMQQQYEQERGEIIRVLKTKYTTRVNKWKARASTGHKLMGSVTAHHQRFRGGMREALGGLRETVATEFGDLSALLQRRCKSLSKRAQLQRAGVEELKAKYLKESRLRKKLFNDIMELRGNIRVFARVRPVVPMEDSQGAEVVVTFPDDDSIGLVNSKRQRKQWQFDHVFRPENTNDDVFDQCKDLLTSVVDGYNVCIFAYGQTGAGKTHTMEGRPDNPGLNARTLRLLFELSRERAAEWQFEIEISLLEVYNEQILDLLAKTPLTNKLTIRRGENGNHVPGLTRRQVASAEEVLRIMRNGYQARSTFATNANEHSSRSHCMLSVYVVATNKITNLVARGKLHLVDLAGSERVRKSGATGDRLKEAQAINKSLSALGNVIAARAAGQKHVPFRDSVLTYLLQDSLSNQSKTLMFVNMSPVASNADESFCSLNFAARVRTVELGKASKNVAMTPSAARSARPRSSSRSKRK